MACGGAGGEKDDPVVSMVCGERGERYPQSKVSMVWGGESGRCGGEGEKDAPKVK